ncbi:autophagy-related protein ATG18 [Acrasis kona]|uniref:Autophagy-related protein ATG18 n=1 Tax=Acrasis kona TaxID=1008807 RepID=A0AAW2Z1C3_9EUKA
MSKAPLSAQSTETRYKEKEKVLYAGFNQDMSCISLGTDQCFKIFQVQPFKLCFSYPGGMSCVQMLYTTSLLGLVGAGQQAQMSPRRLQLFNTSESKVICELNFVTNILNVLMSKKRLVVVLEKKIHLFDISNMKILSTIETEKNPKGLCTLASKIVKRKNEQGEEEEDEEPSYIAYPIGPESNQIMVCNAKNANRVDVAIKAHKAAISALQFNSDGSLLATASNKGTVIRIFSVPDFELLYTLRRGSYAASIYSISFNASSTMVCVSSDTGTIHIYKLEGRHKNKGNVGTLTDTVMNMWDSVRDFAHAKIKNVGPTKCGINANGDALTVVGYDGLVHRFSLDSANGGECKLEQTENLLEATATAAPNEEQ